MIIYSTVDKRIRIFFAEGIYLDKFKAATKFVECEAFLVLRSKATVAFGLLTGRVEIIRQTVAKSDNRSAKGTN